MPLIDPLPASLEEKLAIAPKDLVAAVSTDLDPSGHFGEEWLVLTPARLSVYASNGNGFVPRVDLALDEIKTATVDGLVGGGALLATVDGKSVEVLRYSNAQQRKFGRIAKYINDLNRYKKVLEQARRGDKDAAGKPVEAPSEHPRLEPDKEDQKRCPACKLLLPEGSKVCPACMSKGKAIRRILAYLKPHQGQVVLIWALMIVGVGLSLVPPYLTKPLTDVVLKPPENPLPAAERFSMLGWLVIAWMSVQFIGQALGVWRGSIPPNRMRAASRLGVLGGTFDPIHVAHLVAASCARHELGLDRVLFVVANQPWQKEARVVAGAEDRFGMVAAALAGVEGFEASRLELDRDHPVAEPIE